MGKRPVGVVILTALYCFGGVIGLLLVMSSIFIDGIVLGVAGAAQLLFSCLVSWGLWELRDWVRVLLVRFNVLASLLQTLLGLLFVAGSGVAETLEELTGVTVFGDRPLLVGLSLLVGAALDAFIVWYLVQEPVRAVFRELGPDATLSDTWPAAPSHAPLSAHDHPPALSLEAVQQKSEAPPASAWLVARSGPQAGHQFLLNHERNTIGRDTSRASIPVDDPMVSKQHAQFSLEGGHIFLYDLASTNGTFVNNRRVQKQKLTDGDVVRVGQTEFFFREA